MEEPTSSVERLKVVLERNRDFSKNALLLASPILVSIFIYDLIQGTIHPVLLFALTLSGFGLVFLGTCMVRANLPYFSHTFCVKCDKVLDLTPWWCGHCGNKNPIVDKCLRCLREPTDTLCNHCGHKEHSLPMVLVHPSRVVLPPPPPPKDDSAKILSFFPKTHTHIIGKTRMGKSSLIEHWIREDIRNERPFYLIDPHGTLYRSVVAWCAQERFDINLFDLSEHKTFGFNPFIGSPNYATDNLVEVFGRVWGEDSRGTPTIRKTLRALFYTLAVNRAPLTKAIDLMRGDRSLVGNVRDPVIRDLWSSLKPSDFTFTESRFLEFLNHPKIRAMFEGTPIPIRDPALFNLSGSTISSDTSRLVGILLLHAIIAEARIKPFPKPTRIYVDEAQRFITEDIAIILDEMRKFNVILVLAHHHMKQIESLRTKESIISNCEHVVFGGVDMRDLSNDRTLSEQALGLKPQHALFSNPWRGVVIPDLKEYHIPSERIRDYIERRFRIQPFTSEVRDETTGAGREEPNSFRE